MNNVNDLPMMAEAPEPQMEKVSEHELKQEYRPSNKEALREYELKIRFLSRGCIVSVGCKEIAFEHIADAMAEINAYVANTWEMQQKWRKILD